MYSYDEKSEHGLPWHTNFIGQRMQHNYWLYNIVDKIILDNPQISSIIEIGTGYGALTTVFGLWGIKNDISVLTIDKQNIHNEKIFSKLNIEYLQDDEFGPTVEKRILEVINNKPTWIYCDGGNKVKEFQKFASLIPPTSIISAHDLGVEFREEIDAAPLIPNTVIPYKKEYWMDLNVQLAIFKRV